MTHFSCLAQEFVAAGILPRGIGSIVAAGILPAVEPGVAPGGREVVMGGISQNRIRPQ